jgi:hypothetical protein
MDCDVGIFGEFLKKTVDKKARSVEKCQLFIHVGSEHASATVSRSRFRISLRLDEVLLAAGMTWDRQLHLEPHRSDFAIVEQ